MTTTTTDDDDDEDTLPNTWPKFQRSVSIGVHTNDATEGVECCDNDVTKGVHHIRWQRQRPQMDEEENALLLDEIPKDVYGHTRTYVSSLSHKRTLVRNGMRHSN
jgi:hypothetical protein